MDDDLWVWVEFLARNTCIKFKQNILMKWFFQELKPLSKDFRIDERNGVGGDWWWLTSLAWTLRTYKKVASELWDVMVIDEDEDEKK